MWTKLRSILTAKNSKVNTQPKYTGQYGDIFQALDINRDAGRLVVGI